MLDQLPYLALDVHCDNGIGRVMVHGEVDIATAPDLEDALACVLDKSPVLVIVYLNDLQFIDCAGIRALRRALHLATAPIVLRRPNPLVQKVFRLTGLAQSRLIVET